MAKTRFLGDKLFSRIDKYGYSRYSLIVDSQEIERVRKCLGLNEKFDFYLARIEDGDYREVWGGKGMPYVWTRVYKVK